MSRLTWMGSIVFILLAAAPAVRSQDCSQFNKTFTPSTNAGTDWTQHGTGDHTGSAIFTGSCSYTGPAGSVCSVECESTYSATTNDWGSITNPFKYHAVNYGSATGQATSNGAKISCGAEVAVAAHSCLVVLGCDLTVSINGAENGIGGTVSYSTSTIWSPAKWTYQNTCLAETAPAPPPPPPPVCQPTTSQPPGNGDGFWYWSTTACSWQYQSFANVAPNSDGCGSASPIVIDTDGSGFQLTSAPTGVLFDFYGNARLMQISWTASGSTNGWLALDRNGNGTIDSAKELFGNITDQPTSSDPTDSRRWPSSTCRKTAATGTA